MSDVREQPTYRLTFGLGVLFFITSCFSGFFAGFRIGYESGKAPRLLPPTMPSRGYDVWDIISASPEGHSTGRLLANYITATVLPKSWENQGGFGRVRYTETPGYLFVSNVPESLPPITAILERVRDLQREGKH